MSENVFNQDYYGQTTLAPLGALALILLGIMILLVPRRYACVPMLIMACFVSPAQRIVIFTLNFDLIRIMVLIGTIRVLMRGEWQGFRAVALDYAILIWSVYSILAFVLLYFAIEPLKYKLGLVYDALGTYFLFRMLVRDWRDIDTICVAIAGLSIPILAAFLVEYTTLRNPFAALGGVPEFTAIREGRLRCQGAFAHPILAGCFWACGMPLLGAQFWGRQMRPWLLITGLACSSAIVVLCASSTPVSAVLIGMAVFGLFFLRRYLRWIIALVVVCTMALQVGMNHPIWWLLSYVDIAGGSTGWFRYNLMQQAVNHSSEWWLIGSSIGTSHWGFVDLTNMYVVEGIHGGIGLILLFLAVIGAGFAGVSRILRTVGNDRKRAIMAWALGVALFMHAANFIGVTYFGQINVLWDLNLAAIASLVAWSERVRIAERPRRVASAPAWRRRRSMTEPTMPTFEPGRTPTG